MKIEKTAQGFLIAAFLFFPTAMGLGNVVMILAFLLGIFALWLDRKTAGDLLFNPAIICALGLYALIMLGSIYTEAPSADMWLHWKKYSKLLYIPIFVFLLRDPMWQQRALTAFMLAMGFILCSVYLNVFIQLPWSQTQNLGWGHDHTVIGDYITQNIMMAFFVILLLERLSNATRMAWRIFWGTAALLGIIAITQLSLGRTGYVVLLAALLVYGALSVQKWQHIFYACVLFIALGVILFTSDAFQNRWTLFLAEAQNYHNMEITSIGGRINFWINTWELIIQKPLIGWGTGSYHTQWCAHIQNSTWCGFGGWHPHNQYLFFWMGHGFLGFLFFLTLVFSTLIMAIIYRVSFPTLRLAACFSTIFAVNSLINASLWSSRESHFFIMILALLCAMVMSDRRQNALKAF